MCRQDNSEDDHQILIEKSGNSGEPQKLGCRCNSCWHCEHNRLGVVNSDKDNKDSKKFLNCIDTVSGIRICDLIYVFQRKLNLEDTTWAPNKFISIRNPRTYLLRILTDLRKCTERTQPPTSILNIFLSFL